MVDADAHYWGANGGMTIATGVSSWRDIVAGYSAVQASGAAQPVFSSTSFNGSPGLTSDGIDDCLVCTDAALLTGLPAGDAGGELWSLAQNDNLVAGATFFDLFGYANASQSDARTIGRIATPVYGRTVFGTGGGNVSVGGTTSWTERRKGACPGRPQRRQPASLCLLARSPLRQTIGPGSERPFLSPSH